MTINLQLQSDKEILLKEKEMALFEQERLLQQRLQMHQTIQQTTHSTPTKAKVYYHFQEKLTFCTDEGSSHSTAKVSKAWTLSAHTTQACE